MRWSYFDRKHGRAADRPASGQELSPGYWLAFVLLLVLATSSGLGVVYTTFHSRQLLNALQGEEEQRNRLQVERGRLLLEQSSLVAQGRVEDTAIAELGMEAPDMTQVVVFKSD